MITGNIQGVIEACNELKLSYSQPDENFVTVFLDKPYHFVYAAVPINDASIAAVTSDKDFTYKLLKDTVLMPKTLSFLDPYVSKRFHAFVTFASYEAIINEICETFTFPVVIKKNKGERGINVFVCKDKGEVDEAVVQVFNHHSKHYDNVALAQEYIDIKTELRIVTYKDNIEFMYEKRSYNEIEDKVLHQRIQQFINAIPGVLPVSFAGYDIALDQNDELYLIEINTRPGFTFYVNKHGLKKPVALYRKMLEGLMVPPLGSNLHLIPSTSNQ